MMEFMKVVSLAHECLPEFDLEKEKYAFKGPSPDEVTLVDFAQNIGFTPTSMTEQFFSLTLPSNR